MTTVIPHNGEDIEDDSVDNNSRSSVELEPIEEEPLAEDVNDESSDGSFVQSRDVMAEVMQDFVVTTEQDPTLNITVDNRPTDVGFHSTDAGDIPNNVGDQNKTLPVKGHILFNQVGNSLNRRRGGVTGTNAQKFWIQNLCSTSAGDSSPLLQPEASLFPRHYYASASRDRSSVLGARPLFLMSSKTYPHGFASTLQHARIRMTDPSSSTSTDPKLMCTYYDELGNMSMNNVHSRDVFERGFTVDDKSTTGMAVREKGETNLSEAVDSSKMVMNLSRSQKHVDWDWFLTFTLNQKEHPGTAHHWEWKNSMEWTKQVP